MMILSGDIGGTNSRLRLSSVSQSITETVTEKIYRSADFASLDDVINTFLAESSVGPVEGACFAVAGPVENQQAKITNLPWTLNAIALQESLGIHRVILVNDFAAIAYGIPLLKDSEKQTLQQGRVEPEGAAAIIGAGTGLGQAFSITREGRYFIQSSEGGHSDFAPADAEQRQLLDYWSEKLPRVSIETFLSGDGLVRIFEYIESTGQVETDPELKELFDKDHSSKYISEFAISNRDANARATLECFVRIYASQAANMALTIKATGGVYIAGGIAEKNIDFFHSPEFVRTFNDKAPMQELLSQIPVYVITNPLVGLIGATAMATINLTAD